MHDSYFNHDEAPFVPHLNWTKLKPLLNISDNIPDHIPDHIPDSEEGRLRGLLKCRATRKALGKVVFYIDRGWSSGMKLALKEAKEDLLIVEIRNIYEIPEK